MSKENEIKEAALEQVAEGLDKVPQEQMETVAAHVLGVINGFVLASEQKKEKESA